MSSSQLRFHFHLPCNLVECDGPSNRRPRRASCHKPRDPFTWSLEVVSQWAVATQSTLGPLKMAHRAVSVTRRVVQKVLIRHRKNAQSIRGFTCDQSQRFQTDLIQSSNRCRVSVAQLVWSSAVVSSPQSRYHDPEQLYHPNYSAVACTGTALCSKSSPGAGFLKLFACGGVAQQC